MSPKIIHLRLDVAAEMQENEVIEALTFNPESCHAMLKLNGIHKEKPPIIFPISFTKYDEIERKCLDQLQDDLSEKFNLESWEIIPILAVLEDDENKALMLESIRDYYRENLQQEQEKEEREQQANEFDSVSATLRKHDGRAKPKGTIIGISKIFKAISKVSFYCDNCYQVVDKDLEPPVFSIKDVDKKCDKCNKRTRNSLNPEHKNAVRIELQDSEFQ